MRCWQKECTNSHLKKYLFRYSKLCECYAKCRPNIENRRGKRAEDGTKMGVVAQNGAARQPLKDNCPICPPICPIGK